MIEDLKPLHYTEIGKNREFDNAVQAAFERACKVAAEQLDPATLTVTITVFPPDKDYPQYGKVRYKLETKTPAYKSRDIETSLVGGMPVSTGSEDGLVRSNQLDLFRKAEIVREPQNGGAE